MRSFSNILDFIAFTVEAAQAMKSREAAGLEAAAKVIEGEAKASLGEYQSPVGPFPGWPELSEATQEERARQGYSSNEPLLRSQTLQGAISHTVFPGHAIVGVPETGELEPEGALVSQVAVDQEFGTLKAPPRPFIGPAAFRKGMEAAAAAGAPIISEFAGRQIRPDELKPKEV